MSGGGGLGTAVSSRLKVTLAPLVHTALSLSLGPRAAAPRGGGRLWPVCPLALGLGGLGGRGTDWGWGARLLLGRHGG